MRRNITSVSDLYILPTNIDIYDNINQKEIDVLFLGTAHSDRYNK